MYKLFIIASFSLFSLPVLQAAEWSVSGTVNPSLEYDDNIFMRDTDKLGDYHATMKPTLKIMHELENAETSLSAGYTIDRYDALSEQDTENPFVNVNTQYSTQRSQWGLDISYAESTSRDDAADDTGDFETNSISTTESISPSFSYQLTERDSLSVNASYSEREYSTTDFSNSRNRQLSTSWQHQFTERFNGGVSFSFGNNKSNSLTSFTDDDTYNLSLTTNYDLSEVWGINGSVGVRQLDSERTDGFGVTEKNKSSGSSLDLTISYKKNQDTASVSLSRSVSPSSSGEVNEQDKISANWSRNLTENLSAGINASFQTTRSADGANNDDRENISVSPTLNWTFSPDASLGLSYKYRQQKESDAGTTASSNAIMLTLNYNWDGLRVSR